MPAHDLIVLGASAGGVSALKGLVAKLPPDLPAAIFIVLHLPAEPGISLAELLATRAALPLSEATDELAIEPRHIYVAAPDRHLLLEPGRMRVLYGPRENRHRPAIDPLFRSAAWAYGPRTVGVILTGMLDDGVAGLWAIRSCGGVTVAQDPGEAAYPSMPASALAAMDIDHRVTLAELPPLLAKLADTPSLPAAPEPAPALALENRFTLGDGSIREMDALGQPSAFKCPSCHGTLWEIWDGALVRYRCHTGHAFSTSALEAEQSDSIRTALASSLRAIEEKAELLRRMTDTMGDKLPAMKGQYTRRIGELEAHAATLKRMLPRMVP